MLDDLGAQVPQATPPLRVVSLVPSLTEAIATTAPDLLVGATDWCVRPADLTVTRVRGTKNPDLQAIEALDPHLVVANQEENRKLDVERLRAAGIAVWVTRITAVAEALASMRRLFTEGLGIEQVAWLNEAERVWRRPPLLASRRVAVPIWRDPWFWVGSATYVDDVLSRVGLVNVVAEPRYPELAPPDVLALGPDLVLFPDEPYAFSAEDGPDAMGGASTALIPGWALSWYGPAMIDARAVLEAVATSAVSKPL